MGVSSRILQGFKSVHQAALNWLPREQEGGVVAAQGNQGLFCHLGFG